MPVVSKSTAGTLRTDSTYWLLPVQNTDAAEHLAAGTTLNSLAVGASPNGFTAFYTKNCQSLFITPSIASGTVTLLLTGVNQFNETVSESITVTSTTAQQTTLCYRRLTSIVITAISAGSTTGASDTITIGYSLVNPRVPFLAKVTVAQPTGSGTPPTGAILRATDLGQTSTQPTFSAQDIVSTVPRHNILCTGTVTCPTSGVGLIGVMVDPGAPGL